MKLTRMNRIFGKITAEKPSVDVKSKEEEEGRKETLKNVPEDRSKKREDTSSNFRKGKLSKLKSMSGQNLLSGIEFLSSSGDDVKRTEKTDQDKKSNRTDTSESSDVRETSDAQFPGTPEHSSRTKLVNGKKLKRKDTVIRMEESIGEPIPMKPVKRLPHFVKPSSGRTAFGRSEREPSMDLENVVASDSQKPMDVVVDIHCESELGTRPRQKKVGQDPPRNEEQDVKCFRVVETGRMLDRGDVPNGEENERHRKMLKNTTKRTADDLPIVDSLDLIEEFREESGASRSGSAKECGTEKLHVVEDTRSGRQRFREETENRPPVRGAFLEQQESGMRESRNREVLAANENLPIVHGTQLDDRELERLQPSGREVGRDFEQSSTGKLPGRKRWCTAENVQPMRDDLKPRRKRWLKDASIVQLPDKLTEKSRPIPAPRSGPRQSTFMKNDPLPAYDNAAFETDHEEVLRIETDNQKGTRIKLTRLRDRSQEKNHELEDAIGSDDDPTENSDRNFITSAMNTNSNNAYQICKESDEQISTIESLEDRLGTARIQDRIKDSDDTSEPQQPQSSRSRKRYTASGVSRRRMKQPESDDRITLVDSDVSHTRKVIGSKESEDIPLKRVSEKKSRKSISTENGYSKFSNNDEDDYRDTDVSTTEDYYSSRDHSRSRAERSEFDQVSNTPGYRKVKSSRRKSNRRKHKKRIVDPEKDDQKLLENVEVVEKYISVTVHKSDILVTDFLTRHPMVKVHIVDLNTGCYLTTEGVDERGRKRCLQPMLTERFDFRDNKSVVPNWEEELIFECDFGVLSQNDGSTSVLILFEIVDLLNFAEASLSYDQFGSEGCWHKVAWAFLKPVGKNGVIHTNKKVRLQLYKPLRTSKKPGKHKCEVYSWWKTENKDKYPSSLYVTVAPIERPNPELILYEQLNLTNFSDAQSDQKRESLRTADSIQLPLWSRLSAQSCKIPNEELFQTESSESGSFYVAFSNNGKFLACVMSEEYNHPILVYEIPNGNVHVQFPGHNNFVYALSWSSKDRFLLSVSSDQTACIWDVQEKIVQYVQMLPHPSYVYCGKFHPENTSVIATGCFDHVTRIWLKSRHSKEYQLIQELEVHNGFVNSLCFQKDGSLVTADSTGLIVIWSSRRSRKGASKREWHLLKKIRVREIENVVINTVIAHPLGSRLLVHSRDNGLRMLDLATGVVLQQYRGLKNNRTQTAACISPCGSLVLCGGEDSTLNVWNLENGTHLAKYSKYQAVVMSCVDYHPREHILAYSLFGAGEPVRILHFNKDASNTDIGLELLVDQEISNITVNFCEDNFSERKPNSSRHEGSQETSRSRRVFGNSESDHKSREEEKSRRISLNKAQCLSSESWGLSPNCEGRGESLRMRLQKLNDSERSLKLKSTNRLNNIIEKIDRILSNTLSKSDQESTRSPEDADTLVRSSRKLSRGMESGRNRSRTERILSKSDHELDHGWRKDRNFTSKSEVSIANIEDLEKDRSGSKIVKKLKFPRSSGDSEDKKVKEKSVELNSTRNSITTSVPPRNSKYHSTSGSYRREETFITNARVTANNSENIEMLQLSARTSRNSGSRLKNLKFPRNSNAKFTSTSSEYGVDSEDGEKTMKSGKLNSIRRSRTKSSRHGKSKSGSTSPVNRMGNVFISSTEVAAKISENIEMLDMRAKTLGRSGNKLKKLKFPRNSDVKFTSTSSEHGVDSEDGEKSDKSEEENSTRNSRTEFIRPVKSRTNSTSQNEKISTEKIDLFEIRARTSGKNRIQLKNLKYVTNSTSTSSEYGIEYEDEKAATRNVIKSGDIHKSDPQEKSELSSTSRVLPNSNNNFSKTEIHMQNSRKNSSTPDSTGTYVVVKSDLEQTCQMGFAGAVRSDGSARSDVTFTIENELPVPLPRRKIQR